MPFHSGYHKIQCGQTKLGAAVMCQKMILQVIGFRTELDRTVLDVLDRPPADVDPKHQGLSCGHGFICETTKTLLPGPAGLVSPCFKRAQAAAGSSGSWLALG